MAMAAADKNLCFASYFIPQPKRDAARAVFAFRRLIHTAIDHPTHPGDTVDTRVDLFRDRLDEIYDGRFELPRPESRDEAQRTLAAFSDAVHRFGIPKQCVLALAEARRMDLTVTRYATWNALVAYCDHAAGSFGRILSAIVGVRHSGAAAQLATLGVAIHFTGALAAVADDAATRGRIYLPLEDLARFGYSERQLLARESNDRSRALIRFEVERARQLFREGAAGLCWIADDGSRFAAAAVAMLHARMLDVIERQGYDVFSRPNALRLRHKPGALFVAWQLARRTETESMPDLF
jgi:phytoene synthase